MGRHAGPVERLSRREGVDLELKGLRRLAGSPGSTGAARCHPASTEGGGGARLPRSRCSCAPSRCSSACTACASVSSAATSARPRLARSHRRPLVLALERRLDNVIYRLGFATTRAQARQFVSHGHVLVDGRRVKIPSFRVIPGRSSRLARQPGPAGRGRGRRTAGARRAVAGDRPRRPHRARAAQPGPGGRLPPDRRAARRRALQPAVAGDSAPLPFSLNAALPCRPHAELAASLAAELGAFDEDVLKHGLAALRAARGSLVDLGAVVRDGALRVRADGGVEDLLIHRVVARGRGHAATVAVVVCEMAAGLACRWAWSAPARGTSSPTRRSRRGCSTWPTASWWTRGPWTGAGVALRARDLRRAAHRGGAPLRARRRPHAGTARRDPPLRPPVRRAGAGERGYRVAAAARPSELSHVRVGLTCPAATSPRTRASARRSNAASCCRHSS